MRSATWRATGRLCVISSRPGRAPPARRAAAAAPSPAPRRPARRRFIATSTAGSAISARAMARRCNSHHSSCAPGAPGRSAWPAGARRPAPQRRRAASVHAVATPDDEALGHRLEHREMAGHRGARMLRHVGDARRRAALLARRRGTVPHRPAAGRRGCAPGSTCPRRTRDDDHRFARLHLQVHARQHRLPSQALVHAARGQHGDDAAAQAGHAVASSAGASSAQRAMRWLQRLAKAQPRAHSSCVPAMPCKSLPFSRGQARSSPRV